MYLYLFSIGFTCYGVEWTLKEIVTSPVITWALGEATTTATEFRLRVSNLLL